MAGKSSSLKNKTILITRPKDQVSEFSQLIRQYGGNPVDLPSTEIKPVESWYKVDRAIRKITSFHWVLFTSANGVHFFLSRMRVRGIPFPGSGVKVAAVGNKTAKKLEELNIKVDYIPARFSGAHLARELQIHKGDKILIPRGNKGKKSLVEQLVEKGAVPVDLRVYHTVYYQLENSEIRDVLQRDIDVFTFTSPSTVEVFDQRVKNLNISLKNPVIACIGHITQKALQDRGYKVDIVPSEHTLEGMLEEIARYFSQNLS